MNANNCYVCYFYKKGGCGRIEPCYKKQREYVVVVEEDVDALTDDDLDKLDVLKARKKSRRCWDENS